MADRRFNTSLVAVFAATALLLAVVGMYGVISYTVTQRTQEIGIRSALGARPRDVVALFVGQGARLTLVGLAAGTLLALASTRALTSLLFGVGATDIPTFGGAALGLAVVAILATLAPAWRASAVDPVEALRYE
jgi:ABC-type antimicrobial peptide transport system permease subunit